MALLIKDKSQFEIRLLFTGEPLVEKQKPTVICATKGNTVLAPITRFQPVNALQAITVREETGCPIQIIHPQEDNVIKGIIARK